MEYTTSEHVDISRAYASDLFMRPTDIMYLIYKRSYILVAWFLIYLCVSRLFFVTAYSQNVNTRKWSVLSLIKMPLVVYLLMAFVKMLSMRVVLSLVFLVGLLITGYCLRLYIVSTHVRVPKWL